jgi:WD40 repeat protein
LHKSYARRKTNVASQAFFSPDGEQLATLGDNALHTWSAQDSTLLHERPSQVATFSPDGKRLASVGADGMSIEILDAADWRVLFAMKGHTQSSSESASGIAGVSFSPGGALLALAGYDDKTVRLWNAANGQSVFALQRNNAVDVVAFSPDGKILATLDAAVDASGGSIMSPEGGFQFWGVR